MTVTTAAGTIVVHEPQVRTWPNFTRMTGVVAVAVTLAGASAPVYGTVNFSSLATADVPSGIVSLVNPKVDATHWPTASPSDVAKLDAFLTANLRLQGKPLLPLALFLASIPPADRPHTVPLRTNPPVIYVSKTPAVLIVFDGKPSFQPIPGTALTYAVNTNWAIVYDPALSLYFIHSRAGWFSSPGAAGPFVPAVAPASFAAIPVGPKSAHIKEALSEPKPTIPVPRVIVSTVPAALIDIAGETQFASIPGTSLKYVSNTDSDVFFSGNTTLWYILLSGRWFSAANLNGPWSFASTQLPPDFKMIPEGSPRARVLVSVPGTTQAFYAASAAQVPQVKKLDTTTPKLTVAYDGGSPAFVPIAGTTLKYAANTRTDVLAINANLYYACSDGVWYSSASPKGAWAPAIYVPDVVYTIPASSPMYHLTFVHVYNDQGVAMTSPPAPKPGQTYANFGAGQLSAGVRAAYLNGYSGGVFYGSSVGYMGGYAPSWGGYASGTGYYNPGYIGVTLYSTNPPTYGNYDDTTFARQQRAADATDPHRASATLEMPGHGPRTTPGPNTNVYAADDGVYRIVGGDWQKNAGGDNWTPQTGVAPSLYHDQTARQDGYAGAVGAGG
ncbi:MAG TPA: hypothetical protein VGP41_06770 [Candidatus Lustribacter sp.]|nr:hypothetical protein [Candidatus Lustribacter sp.]